MYKKTELKNGLRVVSHDMKDRDSVSLGIWVGVGGRYEEDRIKGAAHFMEHIVFKGSRQYTCEQIKENIEGVGGALNAFTAEEQTCYYAKIPAKHVEKTFDVLADMVLFPKITQRDVSKESAVILEEIKMYHDLPQYYVMEMLDALVWPNHPLGKSLAGYSQTVSALNNKDLKSFHKRFYGPKNVVVSVCGRFNQKAFLKLVEDKCGKEMKNGDVDFQRVDRIQEKPRFAIEKRDIEQMHLTLGMPGYDENHEDRHALSLLSIILGGNMSSRLFVEIREKRSLAYSISSGSKILHDTGLFLIRAGVDNTKIIDTVTVIIKELQKVKRSGVTKNELGRAKDYLLGQLLLGLEDTMEHMLWLGECLVSKNRIITLQQLIKKYEKITESDIKRVAKEVLDEQKFNLAIVGPLQKTQESKLKQLLQI